MDAQLIGRIILFHRKKSGLSRERCAQLAGVGKTAVFDIEHGKETIRLDTLLKILNMLNIEIGLNSPLMKQFEHEEG